MYNFYHYCVHVNMITSENSNKNEETKIDIYQLISVIPFVEFYNISMSYQKARSC